MDNHYQLSAMLLNVLAEINSFSVTWCHKLPWGTLIHFTEVVELSKIIWGHPLQAEHWLDHLKQNMTGLRLQRNYVDSCKNFKQVSVVGIFAVKGASNMWLLSGICNCNEPLCLPSYKLVNIEWKGLVFWRYMGLVRICLIDVSLMDHTYLQILLPCNLMI